MTKLSHFEAILCKLHRECDEPPVLKPVPCSFCSVSRCVALVAQGQKSLLMKLKIAYERAGSKVQEMASVSSFPPGY